MSDYDLTYVVENQKIIPLYEGGWVKYQPEVETFDQALEEFISRTGYIDAGLSKEDNDWTKRVVGEIPTLYSATYLSPEEALFLLTGAMPSWASYLFEWEGQPYYTMRPDFGLQCILSNFNTAPVNPYEQKIRSRMFDYFLEEVEAIYRAIQHGEILATGKREEPFEVWVSFFQRRNFNIAHIPDKYLSDPLALMTRENASLKTELKESKEQCQLLKAENQKLKKESGKKVEERAERTYLNIIGALLEVIAGNSPGLEKHPNYKSEAKLIEHFVTFEIPGLSKSTLENKFSEAKRKINSY